MGENANENRTMREFIENWEKGTANVVGYKRADYDEESEGGKVPSFDTMFALLAASEVHTRVSRLARDAEKHNDADLPDLIRTFATTNLAEAAQRAEGFLRVNPTRAEDAAGEQARIRVARHALAIYDQDRANHQAALTPSHSVDVSVAGPSSAFAWHAHVWLDAKEVGHGQADTANEAIEKAIADHGRRVMQWERMRASLAADAAALGKDGE